MPRPRGADAAGLLLRELELQPPSEEWHRRNMFGGPWSEPDDLGPLDNMPHLKIGGHINPQLSDMEEEGKTNFGIQSLWPRKRRLSERDAAFGLKTSVGLGAYLGVMGSRRDVITAVWKTGLDGEWYKASMLRFASRSSLIPVFFFTRCYQCILSSFVSNPLFCSAFDVCGKLVHLHSLVPQTWQMNARRGGSAGGPKHVQCVVGHG